jgi:ferredoxin-NADP reductase
MSANRSVSIYHWIIRSLGREQLDYLISNTMNTVTERINRFFWSYDCKAKIVAIRRETADTFPDLNERHVFLCGPQGFSDAVVDTLTKCGFDFSQLTVERFTSQAHTFAPAVTLPKDITVKLKSQNVSFVIGAGQP